MTQNSCCSSHHKDKQWETYNKSIRAKFKISWKKGSRPDFYFDSGWPWSCGAIWCPALGRGRSAGLTIKRVNWARIRIKKMSCPCRLAEFNIPQLSSFFSSEWVLFWNRVFFFFLMASNYFISVPVVKFKWLLFDFGSNMNQSHLTFFQA